MYQFQMGERVLACDKKITGTVIGRFSNRIWNAYTVLLDSNEEYLGEEGCFIHSIAPIPVYVDTLPSECEV